MISTSTSKFLCLAIETLAYDYSKIVTNTIQILIILGLARFNS